MCRVVKNMHPGARHVLGLNPGSTTQSQCGGPGIPASFKCLSNSYWILFPAASIRSMGAFFAMNLPINKATYLLLYLCCYFYYTQPSENRQHKIDSVGYLNIEY